MFVLVSIRVVNFEISNIVAGQLVQSKALGFFNLLDVRIVDDDLHHAEAQ
jgi:L-rhamnose isomerase